MWAGAFEPWRRPGHHETLGEKQSDRVGGGTPVVNRAAPPGRAGASPTRPVRLAGAVVWRPSVGLRRASPGAGLGLGLVAHLRARHFASFCEPGGRPDRRLAPVSRAQNLGPNLCKSTCAPGPLKASPLAGIASRKWIRWTPRQARSRPALLSWAKLWAGGQPHLRSCAENSPTRPFLRYPDTSRSRSSTRGL